MPCWNPLDWNLVVKNNECGNPSAWVQKWRREWLSNSLMFECTNCWEYGQANRRCYETRREVPKSNSVRFSSHFLRTDWARTGNWTELNRIEPVLSVLFELLKRQKYSSIVTAVSKYHPTTTTLSRSVWYISSHSIHDDIITKTQNGWEQSVSELHASDYSNQTKFNDRPNLRDNKIDYKGFIILDEVGITSEGDQKITQCPLTSIPSF